MKSVAASVSAGLVSGSGGGVGVDNFIGNTVHGTVTGAVKADVRQRSVLEKFMCYAQAWKDGYAERRYGWQHFRVIFESDRRSKAGLAVVLDGRLGRRA